MDMFGKALSLALVSAAGVCVVCPDGANADNTAPYPAAIVCSVAGKQNYAYLSVVESDGSARYMTPAGAFATFGPDGQLDRPNQQVAGDCAGKSIADLRTAGQTREFAVPDN